jgi:hypothetical protein
VLTVGVVPVLVPSTFAAASVACEKTSYVPSNHPFVDELVAAIPVAFVQLVSPVPVLTDSRLAASVPPAFVHCEPSHHLLSLLRRMAYLIVVTPLDTLLTVESAAVPTNEVGTVAGRKLDAFAGVVTVEVGAVESTVNRMWSVFVVGVLPVLVPSTSAAASVAWEKTS